MTAPLLLAAALLFSTNLPAQEIKTNAPGAAAMTDTTVKKRQHPQTDILGLLSSFFLRKPEHVTVAETVTDTGQKARYSIVPAVGYTLQTKLAAVLAGNVAFRLKPGAALSTIFANATYTQNKQFFVHASGIMINRNNRYKLVGDYRFYKYPQSTFGLGSNASIKNEDPMDYLYLRFYQTVLRKLKGNLFLGAGYNLDYHWNITHKGNLNGTASDFAKYDTSTRTSSSGITLNGLFDSRDNPINASNGLYTSFVVRNNFKAIGSSSNWQSIIFDVRKYFLIPTRSRNILALWSYNALITGGKPPYLDLPSTGWDSFNSTGRGFIQGRFRGTKMVYLEAEYRFNISRNGLFGGVAFANEEAFSGFPGSRLESFKPGYGAGIRIKLNKHSNTNLAIDYGFGTQGSKGLFVSVGEVF